MVNPTYKHLEASLRLGAFSVGQWLQIAGAAAGTAVFALYLSPFPTTATLFVAIVAGGMPVALSYGAMGRDFSLMEFAGAAWRYWRTAGRYLAGAGPEPAGYRILQSRDERPPSSASGPEHSADPLGDTLWDV